MASLASSLACFPLHEQHICAALHDRKYGSLVVADNGVHLKVSDPFPVCLCWTLVYAYPVRILTLFPYWSAMVLQAVPAMLVQAAPIHIFIFPDDGVDRLV